MKFYKTFVQAILTLLPVASVVLLSGPVAYAAGVRTNAPIFHARPSMNRAAATTASVTAPVNLGRAGGFVILSKSGITNVPTSSVVGVVGTSPITGAADHLTCAEVTGRRILSVDAAGPRPCNIVSPALLTTAIGNMQTAYTDAASRPASVTQLGGGNIGGLTLAPGVYKWGTSVNILNNLTLNGSSSSVWIFQIAQNLNLANGTSVILTGGAQAKNVFWQVAGQVTIGTTAKMSGIILSKTLIAMQTGASINGRLFAQTAVTLQMNTVSIH